MIARNAVDIAETTMSPHHKAYAIARELGATDSFTNRESRSDSSTWISLERVQEVLEALFDARADDDSERVSELKIELSDAEDNAKRDEETIRELKSEVDARTETIDQLEDEVAALKAKLLEEREVIARLQRDWPKAPPPSLTKLQRAALAQLAASPDGQVSSWHFGSTTVNRLRKLGYIGPEKTLIAITEAGRAWSAATSPPKDP